MANFQGGANRGGGFRSGGGKPAFGKKSWGGDRGGDRERVMHKATCDQCGKVCEVPFRPTGEKPVYCSDCFAGMRDSGDSRPSRPQFGDRAPRREFSDRPPRSEFRPTPASDDTKKQLSEISSKLDKLIKVVESLALSKKESVPNKVVPAVVVSTEEKAFLPKKVVKKKSAAKAKK